MLWKNEFKDKFLIKYHVYTIWVVPKVKKNSRNLSIKMTKVC